MADGDNNSSMELIRRLQSDLAEANRKLAGRVEQSKRLTTENAALKTRVTELETANTGLTTDRDKFKAQAEAAPSEKDAEIARLKGDILTRDLRDRFQAVAAKGLTIEVETNGKKEQQKLAVKPSAMAPLLQQLGLKPDDKGELPTEQQITEALTGAVTAHDWAFTMGVTPNPAADAANRPIRTQSATHGPGVVRTVQDNKDGAANGALATGYGANGRL